MPMLFNCLVAVLFLLAYNSVYAANSYLDECTTECKKYPYVGRYCGGMCRREVGAQSFYCFLACSQNSTTAEEFEQCKSTCTGENLNQESCRTNCELVTHNQHMCKTVCIDDHPDFLPTCLFYCSEKNAPSEKCLRAENSEDEECQRTAYSNYDGPYRQCSNKCYEEDTEQKKLEE